MKLRSVYPIVLVPLLCVIVIGTIFLNVKSPFTHATPASGRISLSSSIATYTQSSKLLAPAATDQPISTPQSPLFHQYLSAADFLNLYAPLPSSEAAVMNFLRAQGFTITATYPNHLVVDALGTVGQAEQAFHVHIN